MGRDEDQNMTTRVFRAALVIIGNEILSGRTQDANLAYLAKWLNQQGIRLHEVRVVADETDDIVAAVNAVRARYDYVFTTGGIGPTHDDITVDAIAAAFGVPVVMHPKAEKLLRDHYQDRINDARLRMARVPQGASLIENAVSAAPGIKMENVHIMAGIPSVMRGMLAALEGQLEGGQPVISRTISAYVAESSVAQLLIDVENAHDGVLIGSYPVWRGNRVGANFVVSSTDAAQVDKAIAAIDAGLRAKDIEPVAQEI
jgi:molybdenum cofactor synthesis domain-containing protein